MKTLSESDFRTPGRARSRGSGACGPGPACRRVHRQGRSIAPGDNTMFSKHVVAAAAVIGAGIGLHAQAQAQMSINGGITARFGSTTRSGDVQPDHDNTVNGVDGHFALFLTYTK